jgi:hypothetical protein
MASAEIVAYLNTDDFYLPNTLKHVVNAFAERSDYSMLYGHWMSWHPETNFLEILPVFNYTLEDLATFAVLPQPSVFFKREVFETLGGFDLSYKLLADNDFFSKAAVAGLKFKRIDDYLSIQTVHSGNLLAGNPEAILQAKYEGERYRLSRMAEISYGKNKLSDSSKAVFKKLTLPISWRLFIIYKWLFRDVSNHTEIRTSMLSIKESDFSLYMFFRYLFSRGARHVNVYYRVDPIEFEKYLKFKLPLLSK